MTGLRKFLVQVDVESYEQDIFAENEEQASEEALRELQDAGLELYGMSIVEDLSYVEPDDDDADPFGDEDTETFDAPECTCTTATVDVGQVDPACPYVTGKRS